MKREDFFFYTVVLAFCAILALNEVLDLGLIASDHGPVKFDQSVSFVNGSDQQ